MSRAYWIVRVSVRDEQRYPEYLAAAGPAFQNFGAKFVVRGGAFETMAAPATETSWSNSRTARRPWPAITARNIRARRRSVRNMRTPISSSLTAPPEANRRFKGRSIC